MERRIPVVQCLQLKSQLQQYFNKVKRRKSKTQERGGNFNGKKD